MDLRKHLLPLLTLIVLILFTLAWLEPFHLFKNEQSSQQSAPLCPDGSEDCQEELKSPDASRTP